ncbi:hypothetical protein BKH42_06525 [Helicobacter sp. 13S00482-2]|uniref:shikimate kinase n=1 Tax=Helicobacter sp. 13S00482-2 TaxID=1476200 RepID=UPI000BA7ABFF|nr:shikimate kinase [Helicobacter sp. 13S00482-2]PAF53367.1 hypothetical protein BKH42_06525 [Helicobacter sp. 13S00482-2]
MNNIVIIGFMGSGKSFVGRELAKHTHRFFIDSDVLISNQEDCSISDIFSLKGEKYFRELEGDFIKWAQGSLFNAIIATGGGMPIFNPLSGLGKVIYLEIDFDAILKRLDPEQIAKRPLFQNLCEARYLYEERKSIYERVSDKIINANAPIEEIIKNILN